MLVSVFKVAIQYVNIFPLGAKYLLCDKGIGLNNSACLRWRIVLQHLMELMYRNFRSIISAMFVVQHRKVIFPQRKELRCHLWLPTYFAFLTLTTYKPGD